jgi:excisionase family DNA binding protein
MSIRLDEKQMSAAVIALIAGHPLPARMRLKPCRESGTRHANVPVRLLRTTDAARYVGVSQWTLRRLAYDGKIKFVRGKFLRFDIQDLDGYIESQKESAL